VRTFAELRPDDRAIDRMFSHDGKWSDDESTCDWSYTRSELGASDSDKLTGILQNGRQHERMDIRDVASCCTHTCSSEGLSSNAGSDIAVLQTTLTMKGLSANCTGIDLSDLLDGEGFTGCYDFVYVPWDLQKHSAHGFAFVNIVSHDAAQHVMECLDGLTTWSDDGIALSVFWNDQCQGLQSHISKYRNSSIMHSSVPDAMKPMLFTSGVHQPFPQPSATLPKPKIGKYAKRKAAKRAKRCAF